jgi:predicted homoserine dehydrogenase-like protein
MIRAWGKVMGSLPYYVRDMVATAKEDKAPGNAIYKDEEGVWMTVSDITQTSTRQQVEREAAAIMRRENPGHPDVPPRTVM